VSIHADSIRDRSVDGSSSTSSRSTRHDGGGALARRGQNAADLIAACRWRTRRHARLGAARPVQTASLTESHTAAEHVLRQLNLVARCASLWSTGGLHGAEIADIPSMLIETPTFPTRRRTAPAQPAHQQSLPPPSIRTARLLLFRSSAGTRIAQMAQSATRPELATTERDTSRAAPTLDAIPERCRAVRKCAVREVPPAHSSTGR